MKLTALETQIKNIVTPAIEDLGFALVTLKLDGEGSSRRLTVMAQDPQTGTIGVDQCAKISRTISALLDVEDPIKGAYRLEISSPGLDRPLTKEDDFSHYAGKLIRLETQMSVDTANSSQRKFKGKIEEYIDTQKILVLRSESGDLLNIDYDNIKKARLVITDDILKAKKEKPDKGGADNSSTSSRRSSGNR